jgi:heme-degrading monooxygenase HmoA
MIARVWHGWAPRATAEDYRHHYETEVAGHLQLVRGFRGARLLRRDAGDEVEFTSVTYFDDLAAVRGFAGDDYERAVVEDAARAALSRWDDVVTHHEVALAVDVGVR